MPCFLIHFIFIQFINSIVVYELLEKSNVCVFGYADMFNDGKITEEILTSRIINQIN